MNIDFKKCKRKIIGKLNLNAFSLLEISIVMIIISILSVSFMQVSVYTLRTRANMLTKKRAEKIHKAIAAFVATSGYLPYPYIIEPNKQSKIKSMHNLVEYKFGQRAPMLMNAEFEQIVRLNANYNKSGLSDLHYKAIGIVPFLDLGLSEDDVKDGNGKYFTYAVNVILGEREEYRFLYERDLYDYAEFRSVGDTHYVGIKVSSFCEARFEGKEDLMKLIVGDHASNQYNSSVILQEGERATLKHYNLINKIYDLSCHMKNTKLNLTDENGNNIEESLSRNRYHAIPEYIIQDDEKSLGEEKIKFTKKYSNDKNFALNEQSYFKLYKYEKDDQISQYDVCDTIVFILISHGEGGNFKKDGTREKIRKNDLIETCENASDSNKFYKSKKKGFNDKMFFASKFGFASNYCGFLCHYKRF